MPRYRYQCKECGVVISVFHSLSEICEDCESCNQQGTMHKLLTTAVIINKDAASNKEVGALTEEYIEANREILKIEKQKASRENYEPT